jgi:phage shock protein PspC (stress-responsive transcriptional regulator)
MTDMTETPEPPPPVPPERPPLRRSASDRKLAGVCGGLGAHFGIDPLVFRVVLVVLALFGGAGVLLYGLGWLLIPDERSPESPGQRLLHGHYDRDSVTPLLVVLLGVAVSGGLYVGRPGTGAAAGLLVLVLVVFALMRRNSDPGREPPEVGPAWGPGSGRAYGGVVPDPEAAAVGYPAVPAVAPARPPRERSMLGLLTLSVALLVAGALLVVDLLGAHLPVSVVLAAALLVLGLGLLVGAVAGRARWLVALALPLTLALMAATAVQPVLDRGTGTRRWFPATAAQVAPEYRLGMGDATLDLSAVTVPPSAPPLHVTARLDVGHLVVRVPDGTTVAVHGRVRAGDVNLPSGDTNGTDVDRRWSDTVGGTAPDIVVDARVGVGQLEVFRATS